MRPPRLRRVQAQRKFAQGAYVPVNNVAVTVASDNRQETVQGARNVIINPMSPSNLLDVVSFQGQSLDAFKKYFQPTVVLERLREDVPSRGDSQQKQAQPCPIVANKATQNKSKRKRKVYASPLLMSLRSHTKKRKTTNVQEASTATVQIASCSMRSHSKKPKTTNVQEASIATVKIASGSNTRKKEVVCKDSIDKPPKPRKKRFGLKARRLVSSEFSGDDNQPLTYLKDTTVRPASVAPIMPNRDQSPENNINNDLPTTHNETVMDSELEEQSGTYFEAEEQSGTHFEAEEQSGTHFEAEELTGTHFEAEEQSGTHFEAEEQSDEDDDENNLKLHFESDEQEQSCEAENNAEIPVNEANNAEIPVNEANNAKEALTEVKQSDAELEEALKQAEQAQIQAAYLSFLQDELMAGDLMMAEVDKQAKDLDNEKDAKCLDRSSESNYVAPSGSGFPQTVEGGKLIDAPVLRPTEEEFKDPIAYFEKIWPEAFPYGICKVIPPPGWVPKCKVHDEIRFDVMNQYIPRLFNRWGAAARELCAIKLCLQQQKVNFSRPPVLDGVEINLQKLYHLVQRHGGLEDVINRKKWGKIAEEMHFTKSPSTDWRLDQIYVKYLLPYDTLDHQERQEIMRKVEKAWQKKNQKLLDRAMNPLHRQKKMLGLSDSSDDDSEDEDTAVALNEAEDCIVHGSYMNLGKFKKVATNVFENEFGPGSEAAEPPQVTQVEDKYWRHVLQGAEHLCVHTAAIDTGEEGYGFTKNKNEAYGKHAWNLKNLVKNPRNVLRHLGPVLGMTTPTLHVGMLYSTSCWHKDPHVLSWKEYQHRGSTRIWYGVPRNQHNNFRKAVETLSPLYCLNKPTWLSSDTATIPPQFLCEHNVTLSRVTQEKGEFILVFPEAYTCCISTGYTESESVYFAPIAWLKQLPKIFEQIRESCEPTMFSLEQFLLEVGKHGNKEELEIIQPIYQTMLHNEITNRQMLQERGLKFSHENYQVQSTSRRNRNSAQAGWNVREECEYCRTTLFLSKVQGLVSRNTSLCLEHALKLLDVEKYRYVNVSTLEVFIFISVKELNAVGEDIKRRLEAQS